MRICLIWKLKKFILHLLMIFFILYCFNKNTGKFISKNWIYVGKNVKC